MNTLNRTKTPDLLLPEKIALLAPEIDLLKGNIPLVAVNAGTQEVLKIEFVFSAGTLYEKSPLLAAAVSDLLDEGSSKHSSAELAEMLDNYGAYLQTECGQDWASVTLFTLSKYLTETLPVLLEILTDPVFPEQEIETYVTQCRQRLAVSLEKTDFLARRYFLKALYSDRHPYGHFPELNDYNSISSSAAKSFHESNYMNGLCAVIVAGKFEQSALSTIKSAILSGGFNNEITQSLTLPDTAVGQQVHIQKSGGVQSSIRIGTRLFNRHHPDYFSFTILNTVLGGYFGSRLMSNIREDKGYTYGIGSALVSQISDGYFFISTDVGADVTQNAVQEIYFEVDRLCTELIPEQELNLVRNYLSGSFQRNIDGPFSLADRYKILIINKLEVSHYEEYIQTLINIEPTKLLETAQKHLQKIHFTEVIIQP